MLFLGFGRFQVLMLLVFGLAHAADAVQTMSISYVLPQASCELEATDLELGLLTAMGFAGLHLKILFFIIDKLCNFMTKSFVKSDFLHRI